jgi:hypothetical protein
MATLQMFWADIGRMADNGDVIILLFRLLTELLLLLLRMRINL